MDTTSRSEGTPKNHSQRSSHASTNATLHPHRATRPQEQQHHHRHLPHRRRTRHESSQRAHSTHSTPSPSHRSDKSRNHNNKSTEATERHRRRGRNEAEGHQSDEDHHNDVQRVRARTENTSTGVPPSAAAAVQSLLPATSIATCIIPLDAKLIELLYALSPTAGDRDGKLRVIEEVRRSLRRTGLDIQIYGSLCTGLVIPASDVDCVMMRSSDAEVAASMSVSLSNALLSIASAATNSFPQRAARAALLTGIRTAADRMRRHPSFTDVTCIAYAKVPIVKCRHRGENVKVDLSFEKDGCVSSNFLCELFCEPGNELARPLIVLVKAFVNHCGLDDPSIGGLGSFPISLLVLWYLKHFVPTRFAPEIQHSLAVLLLGFLQYYGTEFDFKRQGIDYVQQKTFAKAPANDLFIVNPIRPGTNCARAATLYATRVVPQFQKAAEALSPLLDMHASTAVMEQRLMQFFAKSLPGVRDWRDVTREAANSSHLPQNMWDEATNLYMGGVL